VAPPTGGYHAQPALMPQTMDGQAPSAGSVHSQAVPPPVIPPPQPAKPQRQAEDGIPFHQTAHPLLSTGLSNQLRSNKAPGTDHITAELIKEGGIALTLAIYKLIVRIWEEEIMPEDWREDIWIFTKKDENSLRSFERKILRRIFGPVNDHQGWRIHSNSELLNLIGGQDVVKAQRQMARPCKQDA
ncbi:hypothetical protein ANN_26276, partial [Periplaneta americana]